MTTPQQLAAHIRQVHFGGNWTSVNLKDTLEDVTLEQAISKPEGFNSIAALVFHMNYFFSVVRRVLKGGLLEGNDRFSFDLPPMKTQKEWEMLVAKMLEEAEEVASLVEELPAERLGQVFRNEKYGTYHRNLLGLVEHTHYHLGQVVIIKKIIQTRPDLTSD